MFEFGIQTTLEKKYSTVIKRCTCTSKTKKIYWKLNSKQNDKTKPYASWIIQMILLIGKKKDYTPIN